MNILFFGGNGWIGTQFIDYLSNIDADNVKIYKSKVRADDDVNIVNEINEIKPSHVVCMIGRTHGPGYSTIDYLEQKGKLKENINDNLYSPITLSLICSKLNIHLTYLGTGCIFEYSEDKNIFTESDKPNFFGSSYSVVKGFTDRLMHTFELLEYPILNARIRMPITGQVNGRNFITKITNYEKICSIDNSMSVLPTLYPILYDLMQKKHTGTINLTNPGVINHNEILTLYKEIVDKNFEWKNFTIKEQNEILSSGRSNNYLDTSKLKSLYPDILDIKEAVIYSLEEMKNNK